MFNMLSINEVSIALFCIIFTIFSYKTIEIYFKRRKYQHIPGPPANGLLGFYLGNLKEYKSSKKRGIMYVDLVNEWY